MARPFNAEKTNELLNEITKEMIKVTKIIKKHSEKIDSFNEKIDNIEKTMYLMNSNIKRNQFLYAEEVENDQAKN